MQSSGPAALFMMHGPAYYNADSQASRWIRICVVTRHPGDQAYLQVWDVQNHKWVLYFPQGSMKDEDLKLSKYPNLFDQYLLRPAFPIATPLQKPAANSIPGALEEEPLQSPPLCAPPHRSPPPAPGPPASLTQGRFCSSPNWKSSCVQSYSLKDSQFTYQYRLKHFAKLPFRNNYHLAPRGLEQRSSQPRSLLR